MTTDAAALVREAREALHGITPGEWDSYTVPGDRNEAPYSAVSIGEHEVELRWLHGSALDANFIAASPALVARLAAVAEAQAAELAEARRLSERLTAALDLVLHDAHPVFASTALWYGGLGGQAITPHCSIINGAPPGGEWAEFDLPSKPLREFVVAYPEFDLVAAKDALREELLRDLNGAGDE